MTKLGKVAVALAMAFSVGAAMTASAKEYVLKEGDDLEATLATARADWAASETDPKEPSVITLGEGTYTLTQEMYLDWPVTLVGATGDPDDVVVEGNKKFRICTINHAKAMVAGLTIAKGRVESWGATYTSGAGVRICAPQDASAAKDAQKWNTNANGSGGTLSNCVITACTINYAWCSGAALALQSSGALVTHCQIVENTHPSRQNNQGSNHGLIVTCASGTIVNTVIARNRIGIRDAGVADAAAPVATVAMSGGSMVNCSVVSNAVFGVNGQTAKRTTGCSGVYAGASATVANTIIAYNVGAVTAHYNQWAGSSARFFNCLADTDNPINDVCFAAFDVGLADVNANDYRLMDESPAVGAGSTDYSSKYGTTDLAGNARTTDGSVDIGAYQHVSDGEASVRLGSSVSGVCHAPQAVKFVAYTKGLGTPVKFVWDFNGDGIDDLETDENFCEHVYEDIAVCSVRMTAVNTVSGLRKEFVAKDLLDVRIGSGTYVVDAKDGADVFQRKYDQIAAAEGATAVRQEFVLKPGTYTITNEVMLTYPWIVRGSTGNPADVIIDVQDKNKAFCLNHASARLESLTVYRARCSGINSYGVVRICSPNGRGNQTNSTLGSGSGGVVSNVVLTACSSTEKSTGHLLLVYASAGVATHCVITNCTGSQQRDGTGNKGMFLQVSNGRADNCLIANNTINGSLSGSPYDDCSAAVAVHGGSLVNSTIACNKAQGDGAITLCAGVVATGGKVVNSIIAANDSRSTRANYSAWSGTASCFVSCLVEPDYTLPNDTCVSGYPLFISPMNRDYRLCGASPCRNVGTNATTWTYGTTDLAGLPRQRDVGGATTIDLGAYQYDETVVEPRRVHYVDAKGTNPVSPYDTPETAATDVFDALKVTDWGHELRLLPGVHPVAKSVDITRDHVIVCGVTGNPEDVIVRAVTESNRCMQVNAGAHALVHSLVLENGRCGDGSIKLTDNGYGPCLNIADTYISVSGGNRLEMLGSNHKGGIVSNCVIRGGSFGGSKFQRSGGVFLCGANALLTHCVVSNNTNTGGFSNNGWFGAAGVFLHNGARAENCLVIKNKSGSGNYYQAAVVVGQDAKLRYSTVTGNNCALVGGVNVFGTGRFEKCVIADNTLSKSDTTDPRHKVWGAFNSGMDNYNRSNLKTDLENEEIRHADEAVQAQVTTNASDLAEADLGPGSLTVDIRKLFASPKRGDFHPRPSSPTVDAVPPEAETAAMPQADLKGNLRLFGDGYDLGAVEGNYKGMMLLVK